MVVSNYYIAIIIGLSLSLLIEIKFGISPGGLIVPSYLALVLDNPAVIVNIFFVSLVAYAILRFGISKIVLIYGKRRFIACVMIALLIKFIMGMLYPAMPFSVLEFTGIGVVASGILANTYFRQGIVMTSCSALLTSGIVFLLMNVIYLV